MGFCPERFNHCLSASFLWRFADHKTDYTASSVLLPSINHSSMEKASYFPSFFYSSFSPFSVMIAWLFDFYIKKKKLKNFKTAGWSNPFLGSIYYLPPLDGELCIKKFRKNVQILYLKYLDFLFIKYVIWPQIFVFSSLPQISFLKVWDWSDG